MSCGSVWAYNTTYMFLRCIGWSACSVALYVHTDSQLMLFILKLKLKLKYYFRTGVDTFVPINYRLCHLEKASLYTNNISEIETKSIIST